MNEELKIIISAEIGKLKANVESAKQQVNNFKEQVNKAKADTDNNFKALGDSIGNGLKKAAAVGVAAIAAVGAALVGANASTEEYRRNQGLLSAAFETAGAAAGVAKETYNDLYRVLGDEGQATEAAQHLAKLTTNEKELSEWTNICQGVYATFGASLPIESLTEASNETAKVGTVTGALADALNWAGINEDAFNEKLAACNSEAEREKLIRETLNKTYDTAAANYEKSNAKVLAQNEAQSKLTDNLAKVGEAIAPVITAFTNFANEALAKVMPYIQELAEKYAPMLQPALEKVAEVTGKIFNYIADNWQFLATMAGIIGGIAIAIGIYNTVAAIKAAMAAKEVATVWGLVSAYAAQAAAMIVAIAPYVLIVAAIAAVIAIIVLCVKHWDEIKEATKKCWDAIVEAVKVAIDWVIGFFKKIIDFVKENWQGLLLLLVNPFAGAFKLLYDNCEGFRNTINSWIEKIKTGFKNGFEAAKNAIITPIQNARDTALGIFDKIKSGFSEKINAAKDAVKTAIDKIKSFFSFKWELPKIKTPKITIKWETEGILAEAAKFIGLKGLPKFDIAWNALGGVFDKPTVFNYGGSLQGIGEAGAEAVVPLENNLGWLDKLATMLNERQGNRPIVLTVDGKVLAETTVSGINSITRQTGSLPLVLG